MPLAHQAIELLPLDGDEAIGYFGMGVAFAAAVTEYLDANLDATDAAHKAVHFVMEGPPLTTIH